MIKLLQYVIALLVLAMAAGCQHAAAPHNASRLDQADHSAQEAAADRQLASLDWLVGHWRAEGGPRIVYESWSRELHGGLQGSGAMADAPSDKPEVYERLQLIIVDGQLRYIVTGAGNDQPVAFTLKSTDDQRYRFENLAHDFPKRIEYVWLDEDHYRVEVSDATGIGGRGFTVDFHRVPWETP